MVLQALARQPSSRMPGSLRVHRTISALLLSALLLTLPAAAQKASESDIKAAYLFNFGKFLREPEGPGAPHRTSFDICVLGQDEIASTLDRLTVNEQNNGVPERAMKVTSAALARSCAILFLSKSEAGRIDEDVTAVAGAPVLTVSDMPQFLSHGGMIEFQMQANHVRFSVSLDPVSRAGLTLSSELLKVALSVTGTPKREGL